MPEQPTPFNRRSFVLEELKHAFPDFLFIEYACKLEVFMRHGSVSFESPSYVLEYRPKIREIMAEHDGLVIGAYKFHVPHVMAWNAQEQKAYDPTEPKIRDDIEDFEIEYFVRVIDLTNASFGKLRSSERKEGSGVPG